MTTFQAIYLMIAFGSLVAKLAEKKEK
ncbi:putative holin-like toxin [Bacillus haynesii]